MFVINTLIEGGELNIPGIRLRHSVHQITSVGKVSVGNVLDQPGLNKVDDVAVKRDGDGLEVGEEVGVLGLVILDVLSKARDL